MLGSPVYVPFLYPGDVTAVEWAHLAPLLPGPARRGRPRRWALRLLVNAIFYLLRTGCAWRALPREYPPWQTGDTTFHRWRLQGVWQRVHEALRRGVRPWCWMVERTLGWIGRQRRLSKDYERKVQTSETRLQRAMIRLMGRRLAKSTA
jgi:transposase